MQKLEAARRDKENIRKEIDSIYQRKEAARSQHSATFAFVVIKVLTPPLFATRKKLEAQKTDATKKTGLAPMALPNQRAAHKFVLPLLRDATIEYNSLIAFHLGLFARAPGRAPMHANKPMWLLFND